MLSGCVGIEGATSPIPVGFDTTVEVAFRTSLQVSSKLSRFGVKCRCVPLCVTLLEARSRH